MSVFPIDWHERALANMAHSLKGDVQRCDDMARRIDLSRQQIASYRLQIDRARELGKTGFDSARFGVKRAVLS